MNVELVFWYDCLKVVKIRLELEGGIFYRNYRIYGKICEFLEWSVYGEKIGFVRLNDFWDELLW